MQLTVWLDRAMLAATLVAPIFLLHGRALAEIMFAVVSIGFLARTAMSRDVSWLNRLWVRIGLVWWGWVVLCSLPGIGQGGFFSLTQGLASVRFLVLVAALEHAVLRTAEARRWLWRVLAVSALYIAAQSVLQFAAGVNLYGYPRSGDGELTGPFDKPRAGPPLARLLFPAIVPVVARLLGRGLAGTLAAAGVALAGLAVMVLIGQRMPLLLCFMGLFVTALLLPALRGTVIVTCILAGVLLAATSTLSPPTFYRLVTKFSTQMDHFPDSPYGQIAARALAIAEAHPVTGRGFEGFRTGCEDSRYFHGWRGDDGGGAAICVQHPHNHYLQALDDSGIPGLILFSALVIAWMVPLARGLWRAPDPRRVGLFVGVLIHVWPIASASSVTAMPLSGWFFLLLGLGLAESPAYIGGDPDMAARRA